jgi:hypothetical protein
LRFSTFAIHAGAYSYGNLELTWAIDHHFLVISL